MNRNGPKGNLEKSEVESEDFSPLGFTLKRNNVSEKAKMLNYNH